MEDVNQEVVSMRQLLECGVHFGHQTKRWNPKMKKYIFTSRNGIHVIDLQQTMQLINVAFEFVREVVKNDGDILFVGTKKQAQEATEQESTRCEMPYINYRWLGGTLTNIATIRQSINKLKDHERLIESEEYENLTKKEKSIRNKSYQKSNKQLIGIKNMIKTPSALFVVDTKKEQLSIKEARKLKIPIVGIVDTNADPNEVDYPIPANDDAIRAVKLICSVISEAVKRGTEDRLSLEAQAEKERQIKEEQKKEAQKKEEVKEEKEAIKETKTPKKEDGKESKKPVKEKKTTKKEEPKEVKAKAPKKEKTEKVKTATKKKSETVSKKEDKTAKTTEKPKATSKSKKESA